MSVFNSFSKPPGYLPDLSAENMPGFQYSSQSYNTHQSAYVSDSSSPTAAALQPQSSQNQQTQTLSQKATGEASDIEKLRKLKESILAGQHPSFKAIPKPDALASLWLGPHPASQTAKGKNTQQEKSVQSGTGLLAQSQPQIENKSSAPPEKSTTGSQSVTSISTASVTGSQTVSSSAGPNGSTDTSRPEILTKGLSVDIPPKTQDSLPPTTASLVKTSDASGTTQEQNIPSEPSNKPLPPIHDSKDPGIYKSGGYDRDSDREHERPGYPLYDSRYELPRHPYPDHSDPKRDLARYPRYNDPRFDRDRDWSRDRDWELNDRELERERMRERQRLEYEKRHLVERRSLPSSIATLQSRSVSAASSQISLPGPPADVSPHPEQRPMTIPSARAEPSAVAVHKPQAYRHEPTLLPRSDAQPSRTEFRPQTTTGRTDHSEAPASRPPVSGQHLANPAVASSVQPPEGDQHLNVPQAAASKMEPSAQIQQPPAPPAPPVNATSANERSTTSAEQHIMPIPQPVSAPSAHFEQRPELIAAAERTRASVSSIDTAMSRATPTEVTPRTAMPSDAHAGAPARHGERDNARPYYPVGPATRPSTSPRRPPESPYDGGRERIPSSSSLSYREPPLGVPPPSVAPQVYTEESVRPHLDSGVPRRPESYFSSLPPSAAPDRRWRERNEYPRPQYPAIDEKERFRFADTQLHPRSRPPPATWDRERPDYEPWDRKHPGPPNWDPGYDDRFIPRDAVRYTPTPDIPPRDHYRDNPRVRPRSPSPPSRPVGIYDDGHRAPKRVREDYDRLPYFDDRRAEYPGRVPSPGYYDPRTATAISPRDPPPYGRDLFRRDMPPPRSPPPFYPPRDRYPPR